MERDHVIARPTIWTTVVAVGALAGFVFAAFSTYDFVAHLDRQVHGIHCSFLPGLVGTDATGTSGCHVTLMSPYSSVQRDAIWGGIPISLPGMGLFAFLVLSALALVLRRRQRDTGATGTLLAFTTLPAIASAIMGTIAFGQLDAACQLCIGIYVASGVCLLAALGGFLSARQANGETDEPDEDASTFGWGGALQAGLLAATFVTVPVAAYASFAPDFSHYLGTCGQLQEPPPAPAVVPVGPQRRAIEVVEVLDPLCPACRGFEQRFAAHRAAAATRRTLLLFPLDNSCNWMVDRAIHPGACAISEAILCAEGDAARVLTWAFEEQETILKAAAANEEAATDLVLAKFPNLRSCVGSPAVKARLNQGLRWTVDNRMPVLTPQVYVDGVRLCDADTDLGMDYALAHLLRRAESGGLRVIAQTPEETPPVADGAQKAPGSKRTIQLRPGTEPAPKWARRSSSTDAAVASSDAGEPNADAGSQTNVGSEPDPAPPDGPPVPTEPEPARAVDPLPSNSAQTGSPETSPAPEDVDPEPPPPDPASHPPSEVPEPAPAP